MTVTILDEDGGEVARVATNKSLGKGEQSLSWDGRTDENLVAPEDSYRVRVGAAGPGPREHPAARGQARPDAAAAGDRGRGRAGARADRDRRRAAHTRPRPRSAARRAGRGSPSGGPTSRSRARWSSASEHGQEERAVGRPDRRPAGTARHVHDRCERRGPGRQPRLGSAPPAAARDGRRAGGVGVVVRPVAIGPSLTPAGSGTRTGVRIDAGGRRYSWALRRPDGERVGHGRSTAARLSLPIPEGPATAYVLTARTHGEVARAVIPVAAPRPRPVLVVLPGAHVAGPQRRGRRWRRAARLACARAAGARAAPVRRRAAAGRVPDERGEPAGVPRPPGTALRADHGPRPGARPAVPRSPSTRA